MYILIHMYNKYLYPIVELSTSLIIIGFIKLFNNFYFLNKIYNKNTFLWRPIKFKLIKSADVLLQVN